MTQHAVGRVVRGDAKAYQVDVDGKVRTFVARGRLFEELDRDVKTPIAVGDRVRLYLEGDPPSIEQVLPRRNWLPRVASSHDPRQQILFANVDQLFLVASVAKPTFSSNRADRILASCHYYEIPATLLLNKVDLDREDLAADITRTYEAAGIEVLPLCAQDGRGVPEVVERLRGKVSVFYGGSGAGKSTLLNAIDPSLALRTGKISSYWEQGKHTTSFSQMHALKALDAWVIDTPGIRVFRLAGINQAELRDCFPELAPFAARCRFAPDCSHDHEPGCRVFEALEAGHLAPTRVASYLEILDELVPPQPDDTPEPPPEGRSSPAG